jgi:hypothetical protein
MSLTYVPFAPQTLILKTCRMYNVFGSGANHGIYAQFMAQSSLTNGGRAVGLLRGAGTRMALWFYAMLRLLRVRQPLTATVHQQKFVKLNLNKTVAAQCVTFVMISFGSVFTLYCVLSFQPFVCFATVINPHLQWTKSSTCHTGLQLPLPSRISYLMMKHCLEA